MSDPLAPTPPSPPVARRVLVVDLGFLGDTLHLIPALHELRRHHRESRLDVVTTPVGAQVLELAGPVDRVWSYPLGKPSPPWWRHLGLQRDLRWARFDLSINFSGADRTLFVAAMARIPRRLTRQPSRRGAWRRWLAGNILPAPSRDLPVYEQRRQLLASAGYPLEPARFDLRIPAELQVWARQRIPPGAVHLSINASAASKEWPLPSWVTFAREALESGIPALVATGSPAPRERQRLTELANQVNDPRLHILDEPLTIPQLAALVARCRMHVGTDSGVTHLAFALGRPTVSIFRDYAGLREWAPHGPLHHALIEPCACVDRPTADPACARSGRAECLARIPPSRVLERTRLTLAHAPADPVAP